MNLITHLLVSWPLAGVSRSINRTEQLWIVGAGLAPDLDGFGLIPELATRGSGTPLLWWSDYHHVLAHNLPFGLLLAAVAAVATKRIAIAGLSLLAFHLHLLCDVVGSRGPDGYQWPIPYLYPFSRALQLTVPWQWALNAWPNLALSLGLLGFALWWAWRSARSPLALVSARADRALVGALRQRFPLAA